MTELLRDRANTGQDGPVTREPLDPLGAPSSGDDPTLSVSGERSPDPGFAKGGATPYSSPISDGTDPLDKAARRARTRARAKAAGQGVATGARVTARGIRSTARVTGRGTKRATDAFQRYAASGGAGESGLNRLVELHLSHTAGDTIMTLSLAGTLFLSPTTDTARGQVAVFLIMTMVPFVLVAPLIGPLLDRFRHGRRWALGATTAIRAFLCWVLADALASDSRWLYPAALGCLVASRAYNITRAAAVPRLLPDGSTLVRANSKISMSGVIGASVGGLLGVVLLKLGPQWCLRTAFLVFVVGTIQAVRLPAAVDSSQGEEGLEDETAPTADQLRPDPDRGLFDGGTYPLPLDATRPLGLPAGAPDRHPPSSGIRESPVARLRHRIAAMPWPVMHSSWSTGGTRILTGFLLLFLAFLAREHPIDELRPEVVLGIVAAAAALGNGLGSLMGGAARAHHPERLAAATTLLCVVACVTVAWVYSLWTLALVGFVNGFAAQVAKLCQDALIQREIPDEIRTSVFAWSETFLQIMWVVGGTLGICIPLIPGVGFGVAAVALIGTLAMAVRARYVRIHPSGGSAAGHNLRP